MTVENAAAKSQVEREAITGQQAASPNYQQIVQYAVKFICGGYDDGGVVAPGRYFTAINVHNPTDNTVKLRKRFSIALPGEKAGPVSPYFYAYLRPGQAMEIDCPDIRRHVQFLAPFLKGFAVIESLTELNVVAVYTAAGQDGQVETMDIEQMPPRRMRVGLPDLAPVPDPEPGIGFCRVDERGRLLVTVRNQGAADAPASTTRVHFLVPGKTVDLPTPSLPAGASVTLPPVEFPVGCHNPDCDFTIRVDAKNEIIESNEANNSGSGTCIG